MTFTTDAIVLKSSPAGESDLLLTLLSRDRGVMTAFAKSARRPKSKLHSGTNPFCYGSFTIYEGASALRVSECEISEIFFDLRKNITALACAQYICELSAEFAPREGEAQEILRLLLNTLHFLTLPNRDPMILKSVFELRLAGLSGYTPDLVACCECGAFESDPMYFDGETGLIYCKDCRVSNTRALSLQTVDAMRHICYSGLNRLFSIKVSEQTKTQLGKVCEDYIISRASKKIMSLDFLKSIN